MVGCFNGPKMKIGNKIIFSFVSAKQSAVERGARRERVYGRNVIRASTGRNLARRSGKEVANADSFALC
jgi:hypothetical protein